MYAENLVRKVLTVTVDQVMAWGPCDDYTHERVEELFAGREALSAMDITELDIPAKDIIWALLREELVPANTLHKFRYRNAATTTVIITADWAWAAARSAAHSAAHSAALIAAWATHRVATDAGLTWDAAMDAAWSAQAAILQTLLREAENA